MAKSKLPKANYNSPQPDDPKYPDSLKSPSANIKELELGVFFQLRTFFLGGTTGKVLR